jgi:hypothetical protein
MLINRGGRGDGERAQAMLGDALAGFSGYGMPLHVTMVEALLA